MNEEQVRADEPLRAAAEILANSYHRSFGMPIIITRGNNVYGPHQYPEKLIPKFISLLNRGRKVTLLGTGANKRNFLFVEDVARAFEVIIFKGEIGMVYNIGGSNERANIDVARDLIALSGYKGKEAEEMITFASSTIYDITSTRKDFSSWVGENKCLGRMDCARLSNGIKRICTGSETSKVPLSLTHGLVLRRGQIFMFRFAILLRSIKGLSC